MTQFSQSFRILDRDVGLGHSVFFIAEAGVSHFGDIELAHQLLDLSVKSKADAFKIQVFDVDSLIAKSLQDWRDRLRPRNLTFTQVRELKDRCDREGILFMLTAHDETRIPWLVDLDVPAIKVGSGERNNTPFLGKLASLGKPMIVSTGMYRESDVQEVIEICERSQNHQLALLHCVSAYPTPPDQVNLAAMEKLKEIFPGPVGYSDHTVDHLAVLGAVARGAKIIEKHITILRNVPNAQDWKVSAGPEDLGKLIADIRAMEQMIGSGEKIPAEAERNAEIWALKSLVARYDLKKGHIVSERDLIAKRPGGGIPPSQMTTVIGRRLNRDLATDEKLESGDLE